MRVLILLSCLITAPLVQAQGHMPQLPGLYKECTMISQNAVRCRDDFGNLVLCELRETHYVYRWSCRG